MPEYLTESMLTEYFTIQVILGRFLTEPERLFRRLAEIYLLDEERAQELFQLTEREDVREICSERAYMQFCRIRQYHTLTGSGSDSGAETEELVALKGAAIEAAANYKLLPKGEETRSVIHKLLTFKADSGCIPAIRVLGILQMEGIFFDRDATAGQKLLARAARWNSIEGLLTLVHYAEEERGEGLRSLRHLLQSSCRSEEFERISAVYGEGAEGVRAEVCLLEKAFHAEILDRDIYASEYARLVYSGAISRKDKERLLFCSAKQLMAEVGDLPLKLGGRALSLKNLPVAVPGRERERDIVARRLDNADLRGLDTYRPLCVSSDSRFLLEAYASAMLCSMQGMHVERIEVAGLSEYDIEPSRENVFVRSCNEDKGNVYMLFFKGNIHEHAMGAVKTFLNSGLRSRFRLYRPGVCLNLSAVLPVCFCDRDNAKKLKKYCDIIELDPVSGEEKLAFLEQMLILRAELYGIAKVKLSEEGHARLVSRSVDAIDRILDRAIRDNRRRGEELLLTEETLSTYLNDDRVPHVLGFGGEIHEDQ